MSPQAGDGSARFPRAVRLTESRDYQHVFSGATRIADRYFTVLAASSGQPHARLGLAVSRRTARRAVDRNRLKRLIRETFRQNQGCLPAVDCIVIARRPAVTADNETLHRSLAAAWHRVRSQ